MSGFFLHSWRIFSLGIGFWIWWYFLSTFWNYHAIFFWSPWFYICIMRYICIMMNACIYKNNILYYASLYYVLQILCFLKLKVCGNPVLSKSISVILPTVLTHFLFQYHILVFLTFQFFSLSLYLLWWLVILDVTILSNWRLR